MKLLPDTHLLVWAATGGARFPAAARTLLTNPENEASFSVVSIREASIKYGLHRADFALHPAALRSGLLAAGYVELQVAGEHALAAGSLPPLHRDPFDRLLIAQAIAEGITLLTADTSAACDAAPVRLV